MINKLSLVETHFKQFVPLLQECYPNGVLDKTYAKKLIETYQTISISDDIIIGLYDNKSACPFFVSNNVEQIFGFKPRNSFPK